MGPASLWSGWAACRESRPRFVGSVYYARGPGAAERGADYIRDYYSFFGPAVEDMATSSLSSPLPFGISPRPSRT
jgi:hypothetical protein